ncbi:hypothetical protein Q0F99_11665 [Rathayibacter oskolensis]|uniref:hypothetical protein n=1 Tax=Rathayibacter oskolensis TaxID=1891671 RepID=UPI00265F6E9D|nr:hypothetical protein [Rathayibacter oskolensis]WKK70515.1 hypothetical protein Q0F99_11665 [Rathayibacter oskolensis]
MRTVTTVSISQADDSAFRALSDASAAIEDLDEACIVGGQMVALLCEAFPSSGVLLRRTSDADAGIDPVIAAAGTLHDRLVDAGYSALRGNHYELDDRVIDILVTSASGGFESAEYGGRAFDGAPGLHLALVDPLRIGIEVTLMGGSVLAFSTRVPRVEGALVLKALAFDSRHSEKDLVDLFNLLEIRDSHSSDAIGGWRIGTAGGGGARRDTAEVLHRLARGARSNRMLREADIPAARFVYLVRAHVAESTARAGR